MARLLLFDIDMTLVRTHGAGRAAFDIAFEGCFGVEGATQGISFDGRTDYAILTEIIGLHDLGRGDPEGALRRVSEAYLAAFDGTLAGRAGEVLPGVRELLARLRESHGALGLATGNMRDGAEKKLRHFGLWECFAAGGFGDDTPVRARIVANGIERLAEVLGVDPDPADTFVIGDTPLDIEAAHLAGARALGVATGRYPVIELLKAGAEAAVEDLSNTGRVAELLGG